MAADVQGQVQPLVAVSTMAGRLADLVRSLPDAAGPVMGAWDLRQLATHVAQVYELDAGLAEGGPGIPDEFGELAAYTVRRVDDDTGRDPVVLARRIEEGAQRFLAAMAQPAGDGGVESQFLAGVLLPRSALAGHLLLESFVHGYDLARAAGRPWALDRAHAVVAVRDFIFELLPRLKPTDMVTERAAKVRAVFDVRVGGVGALRMAFADGELVVGGPSDRPVDCHVWADPRALLLVSFRRVGLGRAVARRQMLAWGRKPWLGLRLPAYLATP